MIIGQHNTLAVQKQGPYGLILESKSGDQATLPANEVPSGVSLGDKIEVFIYTDGEGRAVATLHKPRVQVGALANLSVIDRTDAGWWLDWGLPQDLLLPRSELSGQLLKQSRDRDSVFVFVFIDDSSGKITATTRLHRHFSEHNDQLKHGQEVALRVVTKTDLGYKVLIDESTLGVLFEDQTHRELLIGEPLKGRIKRIRSDGKIDVSLYTTSSQQISDLDTRIIEFLKQSGGQSSLGDKSSPEAIFAQFQVSKKHYKRALGSLYRARKIAIESDHIKLL